MNESLTYTRQPGEVNQIIFTTIPFALPLHFKFYKAVDMLNHPNFKEYQKSLAIIYFAMLVGQIFFVLISLGIHNYGGGMADDQLRIIGFIAVPVLILAGFVSSRFFYVRLVKKARIEQDVDEKFNKYRTAVIVRLGLLETPGIFAIIIFLLTGERMFLGFLGILLFYFVTLFPSDSNIIAELNPEEETYR